MIYIMAHNKVNLDNFYADKLLDKSMYEFFLTEGRVKGNPTKLINTITNGGFKCNKEWEFKDYRPALQRQSYHAPSIMYHMHLNEFEQPDDYVGFLEYDLSLKLADDASFTEKVKTIIKDSNGKPFIIFPSIRHSLTSLNAQNNVTAHKTHWLVYFLNDYNKRFGTTYKHNEFVNEFGDSLIPTQQSFICDINTYREVIKYVYDVTTTGGISKRHCTPRPSTILERFIGVYMFIFSQTCDNTYEIPLKHQYSSGGRY